MPNDASATNQDLLAHAGVLAYLNAMQGVITRLAGNSASAKTWCFTLVGGLLALAGSAKAPGVALIALIPLAGFALVDSMYLAQERLYRGLFEEKVGKLRAGTFEAADLFDLRAGRIDVFQVGTAMESWSVYPIYLLLAAACLLAAAAISFGLPHAG